MENSRLIDSKQNRIASIESLFSMELAKRNYSANGGCHLEKCPFDGFTKNKILIAIQNRDSVESIITLLNDSANDPNENDVYGNNVLIVSLFQNNFELLYALIKHHLNKFNDVVVYDFLVKMVGINGVNEYMSKYDEDKKKILREILPRVSDINKTNKFGNTLAIHCTGNNILLPVLLENDKIDLEITNLYGNGALISAVKNNDEFNVLSLLQYCKKYYDTDKIKRILNQKNKLLESPIMVAIKNSNVIMSNLLLSTKLINVNDMNFDKKSLLLLSIEKEFFEVTAKLISYPDIDLNSSDNFGMTPLVKAILLSNSEIVLSLLDNNVNVNCFDAIGRTPLAHLLNSKYKKFKLFDSNTRNHYDPYESSGYASCESNSFSGMLFNTTALDSYLMGNKINIGGSDDNIVNDIIISKLLQTDGTQVNTSDINGNTPFSLICDNLDTFLFDMLINYRTFDINFKNSRGVTCFDYIKKKFDTMSNILLGKSKEKCDKCSTKEFDIVDDLDSASDGMTEVMIDKFASKRHILGCNLMNSSEECIVPPINEIDFRKYSILKYFYENCVLKKDSEVNVENNTVPILPTVSEQKPFSIFGIFTG